MTKIEILAKYLALHDALGSRKDTEDKEFFDQKHRQIWYDCDVELELRKAELLAKSKPTIEEQVELQDLQMMFPEPTPPRRDLAKELDELIAKVTELEKKVK